MWHLMIFESEARTRPIKVLTLPTIKAVAYVVGMSPQSVSNFYHSLIKPRQGLQYVALFKA